MRDKADAERVQRFMERLGREVREPGRVYLVGGATAVTLHWRPSTVDIDFKPEPESRSLFEALARLKDELNINLELASPGDFIPELPGWRERSPSVGRHGKLDFFHYDHYAQLLAKIERGHAQDQVDVRRMLDEGLVDRARALELFEAIVPDLVRYPALDPDAFRAKVERALRPAVDDS